MDAFFPLDYHPKVNFITWEVHGFSHQISHSYQKVCKTHQMGKAWEIGSHTLSIKWLLFSIRFPSCVIPHHIGKTWVFSLISHSMGKGRKSHQMGKA